VSVSGLRGTRHYKWALNRQYSALARDLVHDAADIHPAVGPICRQRLNPRVPRRDAEERDEGRVEGPKVVWRGLAEVRDPDNRICKPQTGRTNG
jgi:hypothetical protein